MLSCVDYHTHLSIDNYYYDVSFKLTIALKLFSTRDKNEKYIALW